MKQLINTILKSGLPFLMIAFIFSTGCQEEKSDHTKDYKQIIDKYVGVWNNGNYDELNSFIASDFVKITNRQPEVKGVDALETNMKELRSAMSDFKIVLDEEIYSDEKGAAHWTITGNSTASSNSVEFSGITIVHFKDNKLVKEVVAFDEKYLSEQLGSTASTMADSTDNSDLQ